MRSKIYLSLCILPLLFACKEQKTVTSSGDIAPPLVIADTNQIFIVDNSGKQWNITHAVNKYGFSAGKFQFGLGPNAIPPIINPEMLTPGDPGYPSAENEQRMIGAVFNNDARAYSLNVLLSHEIVDDKIDNKYVAIGF
jgi:hypothetical protein